MKHAHSATRWLARAAVAVAILGCKHREAPATAAQSAAADPAPILPPESEATPTLSVGSAAPDFALSAADGSTVRLADALASGPVVVVFYRGDW